VKDVMTAHDMPTMYTVKVAEYLIAVAYLVLFVPFWRFVNATPAARAATVTERGWLGSIAGWFRIPEGVYFHPGHAWARLGGGQIVTVGMDEFAQKLIGAVSAVRLPAIGARLAQGEKAWTLAADGRSVDMLSPVDGTVLTVNDRVATAPAAVGDDPYGSGWLLTVRAPRMRANLKQLLDGAVARRWMEESCVGLRRMMSPALEQLCEDGGVPVEGMARSLDPSRWDEVARRFLLTEAVDNIDEQASSDGLDAAAKTRSSRHGG
jgi:glycine cleavage system H protein